LTATVPLIAAAILNGSAVGGMVVLLINFDGVFVDITAWFNLLREWRCALAIA
jgi:hypothetical protein